MLSDIYLFLSDLPSPNHWSLIDCVSCLFPRTKKKKSKRGKVAETSDSESDSSSSSEAEDSSSNDSSEPSTRRSKKAKKDKVCNEPTFLFRPLLIIINCLSSFRKRNPRRSGSTLPVPWCRLRVKSHTTGSVTLPHLLLELRLRLAMRVLEPEMVAVGEEIVGKIRPLRRI